MKMYYQKLELQTATSRVFFFPASDFYLAQTHGLLLCSKTKMTLFLEVLDEL